MNYGRYKVVSEIGRGSMGVVYQAHDPQIDRLVALKVLRQDRVSSEDYVKRFLKEATAVGRLSHRGIVTVFDIGQDQGTIYIAMELLEGIPLDELLKQQKIDLDLIVRIGKDVAAALHYAHQKGIIHRDIKPANIICLENGEIKVTDFGIAHIEDPDGQQMTQAGEILGTPVYMSPEQVLGQPVDGRSDIYSLGVILYELTTGRRPFKAGNLAALFKAITIDSVDRPISINSAISGKLSALIMRAMARDPADRYESGEKLAGEIDAAVDTVGTIPVRTDSTPGKTWLWGSLVILLCVGIGIVYYQGYFQTVPSIIKRYLPAGAGVVDEKEQETGIQIEEIENSKKSLSEISVKEEVKDVSIFQQPDLEPGEINVESAETDSSKKVEYGSFPEDWKLKESQRISVSEPEEPVRPYKIDQTAVIKKRTKLPVEEKTGSEAVDTMKMQQKEEIVVASLVSDKKPLQLMATLKMISRPKGASIYIDGDYIGKTPFESEVSAAKHEIMYQLQGHGDWKAQLDLSKGGNVPLSIRLLPN